MICLSPPSSLQFRFWQTAPASCTMWEPAKMLGINDFNLQNSKSVTKNFFSNEKKVSQVRWEPYCARGKAGRRQPSCRGFCLLVDFLLFLFHLWLFVVDVAVLLLFFALPITTPGPVARERNWPEVETRLRVYSINFPFIPIFYLITLKWYCRPTIKVKTYETSRWNNQFAFPWEVGMYWNFTTSREKGRLSAKNSDGPFQLPLRLPHS